MERIARKNLDDCAIRAPFGGVISAKEMEVGQQAAPGMPVVRVVKIDRVKVKIAVPEAEIADMKVGRKAEIRVAALGDKVFEGHVVEKGVAADPLSHAYEVKLLVMNPTFELMPGMVTKTALAPEESLAANRTSRACRTAGRAEPHVRVARRRRPCRAAVRRVPVPPRRTALRSGPG